MKKGRGVIESREEEEERGIKYGGKENCTCCGFIVLKFMGQYYHNYSHLITDDIKMDMGKEERPECERGKERRIEKYTGMGDRKGKAPKLRKTA